MAVFGTLANMKLGKNHSFLIQMSHLYKPWKVDYAITRFFFFFPVSMLQVGAKATITFWRVSCLW